MPHSSGSRQPDPGTRQGRVRMTSGGGSASLLPNRAAFAACVNRMLRKSPDSWRGHAVLHIVIDRYAAIDRLCDTQSAHKLLMQVGRIISATPQITAVAYLGDAAFAALVVRCDWRGAEAVADGILNKVARLETEWQGKNLKASVHI